MNKRFKTLLKYLGISLLAILVVGFWYGTYEAVQETRSTSPWEILRQDKVGYSLTITILRNKETSNCYIQSKDYWSLGSPTLSPIDCPKEVTSEEETR